MSDCAECHVAQVRPNHVYADGCVTCEVRKISNSPRDVRDRHYLTIANDEERQAFVLAVSLEHRRRRGFQP